MNGNDPDDIRRNIERTRADLSGDINALADEANPSNVVKRRVEDVKEGAHDLKERVFGSPDDEPGAGQEMKDRAQQLGADARDAVQDAPHQVERRTRGNPLAAGLIAFGLGALVAGLMPSSRKEQELAGQLKQKAQPAVEAVQEAARDAGEALQPQARQAMENVKTSATESAHVVTDEGQARAREVGDEAAEAGREVRDRAASAAEDVRGTAQGSQPQRQSPATDIAGREPGGSSGTVL